MTFRFDKYSGEEMIAKSARISKKGIKRKRKDAIVGGTKKARMI